MGTGVLSPGVKRGRGVTLTTYPHLLPMSWMSRSYTSSPPNASMACSGTAAALMAQEFSSMRKTHSHTQMAPWPWNTSVAPVLIWREIADISFGYQLISLWESSQSSSVCISEMWTTSFCGILCGRKTLQEDTGSHFVFLCCQSTTSVETDLPNCRPSVCSCHDWETWLLCVQFIV
jgi:hypothetical protein